MDPALALSEVQSPLAGLPVFGAGSWAAAHAYGNEQFADLDVFCANPVALAAAVQRLLDAGGQLLTQDQKVWRRWTKRGIRKWKTNSIHVVTPAGLTVNVIYKLDDGVPVSRLSQVLESFDFGHLAVGYDFQADTWRDMRSYFYPHEAPDAEHDLLPEKFDAWSQGLIGEYNGLRMPWRFAKHYSYGYPMERVAVTLAQGYEIAADYHLQVSAHRSGSEQAKREWTSAIYTRVADLITRRAIQDLLDAYAAIHFDDPLEEIYKELD